MATTDERLVGVRTKIERAKKHIRDLTDELTTYFNTRPRPFDTSYDVDPASGGTVCRFRVTQPIPVTIPLIIGDAVHNLRSALDHLVWQLVEANGEQPTKNTAYPVCTTREAFRKSSLTKLDGISPEARSLIESTQPFPGPDRLEWEWLHHLAELDNHDKHRLLIVATVGLRPIAYGDWMDGFPAIDQPGEGHLDLWNVPGTIMDEAGELIHDWDVLYRVPAGQLAKGEVNAWFTVQVGFCDDRPCAVWVHNAPVVWTLNRLVGSVDDLVSRFRSHL